MEKEKVLILGFAKSGYEVAKTLIKRDYDVIINDGKGYAFADYRLLANYVVILLTIRVIIMR